MTQFIGGREMVRPTLEKSLDFMLDKTGHVSNTRTYFYVRNHKNYSDTEVLVTPVDSGLKIALPNYKNAREVLENPASREEIKQASLDLVEEHVMSQL